MAWCRLANLDPAVVMDVLTFVCCRRFFFFFQKQLGSASVAKTETKGSTTAQHPYVPMHCLATSHRTKHASRVQRTTSGHTALPNDRSLLATNIKGILCRCTAHVEGVSGFGQVEWGEEGGRSRRM